MLAGLRSDHFGHLLKVYRSVVEFRVLLPKLMCEERRDIVQGDLSASLQEKGCLGTVLPVLDRHDLRVTLQYVNQKDCRESQRLAILCPHPDHVLSAPLDTAYSEDA